ncbi:MAG: zf-HC2 domain-containing protein [Planctomycetes bacterium]|nr:zf-HC2 domain-containing protein [Planctomycetota bacterium]
MNCGKALDLMPALIEQALDAKATAAIQSHLGRCTACLDAWQSHQAIDRHFRETDVADRPESFWEWQRRTILDQIVLAPVPTERPAAYERFLRFSIGSVAAAALLLALAGLLKSPPSLPPDTPVADTRVPPKPPEQPPEIARDPAPEEKPKPKTPAPPAQDPEIARQEPTVEPPKPPVRDDEKKDRPPAKPDADSALAEKDREPPPQKPPKPEPEPPPAEDKKVAEAPPPKPEKEDPIAKKPETAEEPPPTPTPAPDPPPSPPPAPEAKAATAKALPGEPLYPFKLTEEQVAVLVPRTQDKGAPVVGKESVEQALSVLAAARARLAEAQPLFETKQSGAAAEVIDAYAALIGEGVVPLMRRLKESNDRTAEAEIELKRQSQILEGFPPAMKNLLEPAVTACNLARSYRPSRHSLRSRPKYGAVRAAREILVLLDAKDVEERTRNAFYIVQRLQEELLTEARAGREPESRAASRMYQLLADTIVYALSETDPSVKSFARACVNGRKELDREIHAFKMYPSNGPLREVIEEGGAFAVELRKKMQEIELGKGDWAKRERPKEQEKQPEKPPPKEQEKPPPPPFGEDAPDTPPPPPPEGFEDPK